MGNFAIMRVEKVKTMSSLAARGRHNFREQDTPNADSERSGLNVIEGAKSTDELLQAVSDLLPSKRRKDAVIGLEYLITASPEHFGDWMKNENHGQDYFADAIRWLEEKHGKANVVCKTVHLDESTPHLAAFVVPLKDGKLNAKAFTGGAKVLAQMQTSFAVEVGAKHGLDRGVERSKAVHQDNAKIQPMTIERMHLRKRVQALEAEVERLTKSMTGGADALKKAQAELAKEQSVRQRLMQFSMEDAGKVGRLTKENEEMKKALITATERDHQLVAEIKALRKENERVQPTQEQLKAIDRVIVDQTRERMAQEALERASEAQEAWVSARGDLPSPDVLASRLRLTSEAGLKALVGTGRVVESHGLHAVMTYRGEKFLHKFESKQELELAIGRGKGMAMGGRA